MLYTGEPSLCWHFFDKLRRRVSTPPFRLPFPVKYAKITSSHFALLEDTFVQNNEVKLEKKLSRLNVWALAFGCIIGWGAFVMPGNTFLPKAGPLGTAIAMGVAAVIMIIIALNYHYMIEKYPVSGGEFTYTNAALAKRTPLSAPGFWVCPIWPSSP